MTSRWVYVNSGKRLLDLLVALPAIVMFSPLLAAVAALVRIRMGSPVLFRQQRPGLDSRLFTLRKFRTMIDATDGSGQSLPDSQRLTTLGRILRSTSLDELPELFNVVAGDMSMVGPRPLLPRYLERYSPEEMRRHEVRPGITGLAQINGRNNLTWSEKFAMDIRYVDNVCLRLDLEIMAVTLVKIVRRADISQTGVDTADEFWGHHS